MLVSSFFAGAALWLGLILLDRVGTLQGHAELVSVLNGTVGQGDLAGEHQLIADHYGLKIRGHWDK